MKPPPCTGLVHSITRMMSRLEHSDCYYLHLLSGSEEKAKVLRDVGESIDEQDTVLG